MEEQKSGVRDVSGVANFDQPMNKMLGIYAKLYYYLAKEMIETFGAEGEQAVRRGVRAFAEDRGRTLRKEHKAQGLEINVLNLFQHYDLPSGDDSDAIRNRIQLDVDNRVSETLLCYLQVAWEEAGGDQGNKIGSIYCDEFHPAMWAAYDANIVTTLPRLLSKNDPFCRFEVHRTPKDAAEE